MYATQIGQLQLPNLIYNAAGVWDTTLEQCHELLDNKYCGAAVSKTATLYPRTGNVYPKYHFSKGIYSINANGLENHGFKYYQQLKPDRAFLSLTGTVAECIQMLTDNQIPNVELNLSCPNIQTVGAAYTPCSLNDILRSIFESVDKTPPTLGLKLPPFFLPEQFSEMAEVLENYPKKLTFLTCINSVPNGMDFDIDNNWPLISPNGGYGGLGGPAILPIGLSNIRHFRKQELDLDLVGCGGVQSGNDVYKYLLAGAKAVQVGTHLWKYGPKVFKEITSEFDLIMKRKGYLRIVDVPSV
jgi:dihydroorotate dehydrogenase (fumarate)